jgi:excisionase family DNA binding protein
MKLTPRQAAEKIGVSESLVYQLCQEKRLPHFRVGGEGRRGKSLIDEQDLEAFMQGCRVEAESLPSGLDLPHLR